MIFISRYFIIYEKRFSCPFYSKNKKRKKRKEMGIFFCKEKYVIHHIVKVINVILFDDHDDELLKEIGTILH